MEMNLDYKQTEVGVIPKDWQVETLGGLASVAAGGTPSRRIPEYWNGDIPWVTTTEIDFNTIRETEQSISALGLKNSAAKLLAPGTLLLALYGQGKTRGKVALLGIQATTNQACAAISLAPSASRSFVFHFLASQYLTIRGLSNSGSQENLNSRIVKSILVPLPPTKVEQEVIAEALIDADAYTESLEQLISKKRKLKQGAMQELLHGTKRLPGFGGEWVESPIADDIELVTGFPFPSNKYSQTGVRLLRGSNVKRGTTDWSEQLIQYWPSITTDIEGYRLGVGDLVIAMDGSLVGRSYARLSKEDLPALLLQRVARIRSKTIDIGYLTQQVGSDRFVKYCDSVKTVTAIPHISPTDIRNFRIARPLAVDEQVAISAVLSDMDDAINACELKLRKAQQLKQGMMQELLTGRIRLV